MNEAPGNAAALREQVRERGRLLLDAPPWSELRGRLTLLLVEPPDAPWVETAAAGALWVVIEAAEARALPAALREPLQRDGSTHKREETAAAPITVSTFTLEHLAAVLDGVGRRSLEVRWSVRHAQPLHDPLRRLEQLVTTATRLPEEALERMVRPLYLQAYEAVETLAAIANAPARASALITASEAAGALARLACVLESGCHPPASWLLPAAGETELGGRIRSWLDDLVPALGGAPAATRRVVDGCASVAQTTAATLRLRLGNPSWLQSPQAAALRVPR
ncbi:MAG: hypothetical protein EXR65_03570 [Dehalococcoidia bacterium]|nr:hypothetical protein [Dehalococcoidia bacterium]